MPNWSLDPDKVRAVAELLGAVAWPLVTVFGVVFFRTEIRALARRLRKGAGAEFDPPEQASSVPVTLATVERSAAVAQVPTTAHTLDWESTIKAIPALAASHDPQEREAFVTRLLARAMLFLQFEQIDSYIWASQLQLLDHLNLQREGETLQMLRERYFEPAARQHPELYRAYSFEGYMSFLMRYQLVEVDGSRARITQLAVEFLAWRVEQARPVRNSG